MSVELPVLPSRPKTVEISPSFFGVFRGLWNLTWRSHISIRRLPVLLLTLLFIPVMTWITVDRQGVGGEPATRFLPTAQNQVARLTEVSSDLSPEAQTSLQGFLEEEMAKIKLESPDKRPLSLSETADEIRGYYKRSLERSKKVLGFGQQLKFGTIQQDIQKQALTRAKESYTQLSSAYYRWLINFYFLMMLPIYCLSNCGAMIRDELQSDTLGFLLTRPLTRAQLVLGKFFAHWLWLQIFFGVHTLVLLAVGVAKGVPEIQKALPLLMGVQVLAVSAWTALATLFGLINRRYMILGVIYGFVVELGLERIPTNINALSITRHLKTLLAKDSGLDSFYEWSQEAFHFTLGAWTPNPVIFSTVCLILAPFLLLTLASLLFTYREYSHGEEMQK